MNFISKNLRKSRYFNLVLIVISLALSIYKLTISYRNGFDYIYRPCLVICLISALIYALYGYKKESAIYYKTFIFLYFVSLILSVINEILTLDDPSVNWTMISTYADFARVIPIILLTFIPNFGEKRSKICSYILFGLSLFIFVRACIVHGEILAYIISSLVQLTMSAVAVVLVNEKYVDKASRGAK